MTFITAKFFQPSFSPQEACRHFPPRGEYVHMWTGLQPQTLSPPSIPPHLQWGELCSVTSSCGGGQIPAELGMVFPTSQREFNVEISLSAQTLSLNPSRTPSHRKVTAPLPWHQSTAYRALHKVSFCYQGIHYHHPSRPQQATTALTSSEQPHPTLKPTLHERPAQPFLPKMSDDYRSQVETTQKCTWPWQHPKKTPSLVPQLLPWMWNPLAVHRS